MISGLAHALGGPLQVALSELDLCRELCAELLPQVGAAPALSELAGAADRATQALAGVATLAAVLRRLDRPRDERPAPLQLDQLLREAADFVARLAGPERAVHLDVGALPPGAVGREGDWTRALVALLSDAVAASPAVRASVRLVGDRIEIAISAKGWTGPELPAPLFPLEARPVLAGPDGGCWSVSPAGDAAEEQP